MRIELLGSQTEYPLARGPRLRPADRRPSRTTALRAVYQHTDRDKMVYFLLPGHGRRTSAPTSASSRRSTSAASRRCSSATSTTRGGRWSRASTSAASSPTPGTTTATACAASGRGLRLRQRPRQSFFEHRRRRRRPLLQRPDLRRQVPLVLRRGAADELALHDLDSVDRRRRWTSPTPAPRTRSSLEADRALRRRQAPAPPARPQLRRRSTSRAASSSPPTSRELRAT